MAPASSILDRYLSRDGDPVVTIRRSTPADAPHGAFAPLVAGHRRQRRPKYLVVNADHPESIYTVFGLVQGGDTRAEAVFWAERLCSKNGLRFVRPEGWERVEGELPERAG